MMTASIAFTLITSSTSSQKASPNRLATGQRFFYQETRQHSSENSVPGNTYFPKDGYHSAEDCSLICALRFIAVWIPMKDIAERILQLLHKDFMTTADVARHVNLSWSTANTHLLKLVNEGKASLLRKGRVNIYHAKTSSRHILKGPRWIRLKSLEQLSDELEEYFPSNMTTAEMIEKQRRRP